MPVLQETVGAYENVRIVQGDILKVNIPEIIADVKAGKRGTAGTAETAVIPEGDAKAERGATDPSLAFKVCANLPYYISTPIIMNLLEQKLPLERLVVMVQKEVAERMTATPGGREYGAISVAMQYYTEPKIAFIVKAGSFLPAPKVDSAVLVCKRRTVPPVDVPDEKIFFKVVAAAFSVRRKMLTNSLKNMGGLTGEQVKNWLDRAGIDGKRRAETLSLEEFAMLARAWEV